MVHLWKVYGDGLDEGLQGMKQVLIGDAWGVVLDLGAGGFSLFSSSESSIFSFRKHNTPSLPTYISGSNFIHESLTTFLLQA